MEGRPLEEGELVERAQRGDLAAYEELVRRYQDVAVRTAYLAAGSKGDAEDAAQEAFVKAYRALGRFRRNSPFRPWLLRIVVNEAISRRRAEQRQANLALKAARAVAFEDAAPSPEVAALALEQHGELVRALNTLRPEDRLIIAYRYFLDLSEAEMAEAIGCARGTVKSRLSRSLRRLKRELAAGGVALAGMSHSGERQAERDSGDGPTRWGVP
jgi:RNA polymerase sigma factor (sigma-70 family)